MKYIVIILILFLASCKSSDKEEKPIQTTEEDSVARHNRLLLEIEEEAKPVYVKAYTQIAELRSDVNLVKQNLLTKKEVVQHYNETVGGTMGHLSTFEAVDKRLIKAGDEYVQFMFKKECARIANEKAAEAKFESQKK